MTLSKSSIHRQRKKTIKKSADKIKKDFIKPDGAVLHYDGKIVEYANGSKEDRLAVVLSAPTHVDKQFLGSPVILNETGAEQAATLVRMIDEWGIREYVTGQVCDTTA